jgi:hypothetical protein
VDRIRSRATRTGKVRNLADHRLISCLVFAAYGAVPVSIAWFAANTVEPHRAVAIALQISLGGFGGLAGSFIYLDSESPKYYTGYFTSL